jgi:hypothetical protein
MSEIIINTIEGTYIVPRSKYEALVSWLKQNAVLAGQQTVKEFVGNSETFSGRTLINEHNDR